MEGQGNPTPRKQPKSQEEVPLRDHQLLSSQQQLPHTQPPIENSILVTEGMILVDQLKDYTKGSIKGNFDERQPSYTYTKPYTQKIEELKMPFGY